MLIPLEPVHVLAPAKINLFLSVEGRRQDGYHELCSVMCTVSLYDSLFFSFQRNNIISVFCDHPNVLDYESNLVYKAISLFFKELKKIGVYVDLGVSVYIGKKIPVGAGFGGGSSDAAFTLLLLNDKLGSPFSKRFLMNMGRVLGADVPFFIFGKPALARGVGDRLRPFMFMHSLPKFALLLYTGLVVSTSWVYENISFNRNLRLTKDKKKLSKALFSTGDFDYKLNLFNDLENFTEVEFPVIAKAKAILLDLGAVGALMSGSGSGVFGLFEDSKTAVSACEILTKDIRAREWSVSVVELLL